MNEEYRTIKHDGGLFLIKKGEKEIAPITCDPNCLLNVMIARRIIYWEDLHKNVPSQYTSKKFPWPKGWSPNPRRKKVVC